MPPLPSLCPLQAESSEGVRLDICLNTGALCVSFQQRFWGEGCSFVQWPAVRFACSTID